ncbi:MAG: UDP-diphosphatase [Bacteroides sp. SM23_62_1]|nr:MAG: UDP-diphosphatase [Bacteroides sp. SM23_62_1]
MEWYEALILGITQGLTEFLPVSSSGHLELGRVILHIQTGEDLSFAVAVHGATVLSIITVFWSELVKLATGISWKWNTSTQYVAKLLISMIPVAFVGFFLKDYVEKFYTGNPGFVGSMLIITACLLILSHLAKDRNREITFISAILIGIAQAIAVMPGISRSGATISTGLLLGNKKDETTKFSFLMVLLPIIGANLIDLLSGEFSDQSGIGYFPLLIGFMSAFLTGYLACRWMLRIVRKGKLIYFGIYCFLLGVTAIIFLF